VGGGAGGMGVGAVGRVEVEEVRRSGDGRTNVGRGERAGVRAVVEPQAVSIPPDLIGAFANALADAEEIARLGAAETDRAAFGLDAGATRVEVRREGGEPVGMTTGGAHPTGTAGYAQRKRAAACVPVGRTV